MAARQRVGGVVTLGPIPDEVGRAILPVPAILRVDDQVQELDVVSPDRLGESPQLLIDPENETAAGAARFQGDPHRHDQVSRRMHGRVSQDSPVGAAAA